VKNFLLRSSERRPLFDATIFSSHDLSAGHM